MLLPAWSSSASSTTAITPPWSSGTTPPKGYGVSRVREELRRRKLDRELWDAALEEMPEPDDAVDTLLRSKMRGKGSDGTRSGAPGPP